MQEFPKPNPDISTGVRYIMYHIREPIYRLLQDSLKRKDLVGGREAHFFILVNEGMDSVTALSDHLIRLYATCGSLFDANLVFCTSTLDPTPYTWQAIISAHVIAGEHHMAIQVYQKMQESNVSVSKFVLSCVLKACACISGICDGRLMHDHATKIGVDMDVVVGSALIDMYAKSDSVVEAKKLFDDLPLRNVVSWAAIISCYGQQNSGLHALELFEKMQKEGTEPDQVTLLCMLKACGNVTALLEGRNVHEIITMNGFETDVTIGNTLVDLYARCGSLEEAQRVFTRLPIRTIVSFGAMIAGYAQSGPCSLAIDLFRTMQQEGISPNNIIYISTLKACGGSTAILVGMLIHQQIIDSGFETDMLVGSSLIDMYSKCGGYEEACKVLTSLSERDVVSWGAAISGYAQDGHGLPALELYAKMQEEGIKPDKVSILCALKACANIGAIDQGRLIHREVIKRNLAEDIVISNTLVDMYAKCGNLEDSQKTLENSKKQDIVSWNAIISGHAQHGECISVRQYYEDMQKRGCKPDHKTYTSILMGCSHAGLVEQGHQYFKSMTRELGQGLDVEAYSCMVDLLGRSGSIDEARDLLNSIPVVPDLLVWKSLLTSCRTYNTRLLGRWAFDQLLHCDSNDAFGFVVMSNMYSDAYQTHDPDVT